MSIIKNFIEGNKLKCSICGEIKVAEGNFYRNKTTRLGYSSQCKCCSGKRYNKEARYFNGNGDLKCRECKEYKSIDSFHKDTTQKYRKGKAQTCKKCESERKREARLKGYEDSIEKVLASIYNGLNTRSKGLHDLSKDYLLEMYNNQNGLCAISNIPMTAKRGQGRFPYNISIDQIEAGKGYTKDNTQLVCAQVNMMKGVLSIEELVNICKSIIEANND